jgi:small GTP-binding protein
MLSCRDVELRVYTEHVATKVELILAGTDNIDVQIPQIIRSISKTRGGELPKGHFSVKIIMTGNYQAGKSSLTKKFVQNQFHKNYQSTIGVDITEKLLEISNETKISFMIWDIGGQITHMAPYRNKFYEGANAAFIVIDRTRRDHLNSVELWYNDIKKYVKKNLDVILIGNKSDLLNEIVINDEDIKKVADQFGFHYILTSAKTGENVNDAFSYIAYKYLENI